MSYGAVPLRCRTGSAPVILYSVTLPTVGKQAVLDDAGNAADSSGRSYDEPTEFSAASRPRRT
jgi:hypothetical protein